MNYGPFWYLCNLLQTKVSLLKEIKKATVVFKLNSFQDSQLWKLDDENKLQNKEERWTSDDNWNFKPKAKDDDIIYIENTSEKKVLEFSNDGVPNLVELEEGKAEQLWKKKANVKGYFTLENIVSQFALTAVSETNLQLSGTITLRCIVN